MDAAVLDPRNSYDDRSDWESKAKRLAQLFIDNFDQYTDTEGGKKLVSAGPLLD